MRDEDDGFALRDQGAHNIEQLIGFLRGEDGGWLVKNENFRVAVEQLDDFNALLNADRQVAHIIVRVHFQLVAAGNFLNALGGFGTVQETAGFHRFVPEHHVFSNGEDWNEHEMLVDHANTLIDSVGRGVYLHSFAVDEDFAFIRLI